MHSDYFNTPRDLSSATPNTQSLELTRLVVDLLENGITYMNQD